MAVKSPFPDVDIPDVSLHEFILDKVQQYTDRQALIDDATGCSLTFKDFTSDVRRVSQSLYGLGIQKNDVVALYLPNLVEYPILLYGTLLAGGTVAGVVSLWSEGETKDVFENASPRFIFTLPNMVEKAIRCNSGSANLQEVFTVTGKLEGYRSYQEFLDVGADLDPPRVKIQPREDVAILTYTTGTTGPKKGVMFTHYNLVANILQVSCPGVQLYSDHDTVIAIRPATHGYGLAIYFTSGVYNGCTSVITEHSDPDTLLRLMHKYKVTVMAFTPLNLVQLIKNYKEIDAAPSSLGVVLSAGAPLNLNVYRMFTQRFHTTRVKDVFGMSEVGFVFMPRSGQQGKGVGVPLPNVEVKIIDTDSGDTLGPHARGEIYIRSPTKCKGYKNRPEADAEAFQDDGWLRTGDVAYFDDDLNFYIVDRIKELITYDSRKISPLELEGVILQLPGVAEVGVIGVPDEDYVELARAFVIKQPGVSLTEQDVVDIIKRTLMPYKWLHGGVKFVDSLPKAPTGKVMRRLIKENMLRGTTK